MWRRDRRYQDQAWRWPPKTASLDSVCARRPVRLRSGRKKACGAVEQKKWSGPQFCLHPGQRLENGSVLARTFFTSQFWSEQPCVRPIDAARMTAGHNALRGSGPGQKPALDSAVALVGCPDLRIDRICITCCWSFPTFTSRRLTGAISFTPRGRQVPCSARLWPS
jgi:hypothetical protein